MSSDISSRPPTWYSEVGAYRTYTVVRADAVTVTAAAEVAGQLALGRGLTSQFRPRQYFTIPKASLERFLDDMEQFINFFVIESQRIVFAENVYATVAVSKTVDRLAI
jgi:hypothetical protein